MIKTFYSAEETPPDLNLDLAPQPDPYSCHVCCLAQIDNVLQGVQTTVEDVDRAIGRAPNEDPDLFKAYLWLPQQGYRVETIKYDATGFKDYLSGKIDHSQYIKRIADIEYCGDLTEAKRKWGGEEVRTHWEKQRAGWRKNQMLLMPHKDLLTTVERVPSYQDLLRATNAGKLVLSFLSVGGNDFICHSVLWMRDEDPDCASVYSPSENGSSTYTTGVDECSWLAQRILYNHGIDIVSHASVSVARRDVRQKELANEQV